MLSRWCDAMPHSHHGRLRAAFLLLTGGNARAQDSAATDRAALVALYVATGGANWENNTKWSTTAAPRAIAPGGGAPRR